MPRFDGFTQADVPILSDKCYLVTGASSGIGFQTARVLAARGARVLLASQERVQANDAMDKIRQESPKADLAFLPINLADLDSINTAAEQAAKESRIDALINNAGVMQSSLSHTKQGFELQFGVNYLGAFALTALLLPKLAEISSSRVVINSSNAHRNAKIDWDDLNAKNSYSGSKRYAASKLASALFFFELNRRLHAAGSSIISVGVHPGAALTGIQRNMGALVQLMLPILKPILNTAETAAWSTLQAATGPVMPGGYYGPTGLFEMRGPSRLVSPSPQARNIENSERLWEVSVAMTGVDPRLSAVPKRS